jgi:hypothetical protein
MYFKHLSLWVSKDQAEFIKSESERMTRLHERKFTSSDIVRSFIKSKMKGSVP